jgi:carbon-monoxide dehydrogenase medium subunit
MLPEFDLLRPRTLPEALDMLAENDVLPIAGGTNVVVDLRAGKHHPRALVDIGRLEGLRGIRHDDSMPRSSGHGHLVIGGGTTISDLLHGPLIAQHAPALREAAQVFANPLIRTRATVGGNLVDASPAADTAPPLLALDAEVELSSRDGTRHVPLADFLVGVRKTLRRPDELLTAVRWPVSGAAGSTSHFHKLGLRKADAISVLSVALAVEWDDAGRCTAARIALGALAPRPLRATLAEEALIGRALTPAIVAEAARLAGEATRPIDDIRGTASYRREVTEVIVRRLLSRVLTTEVPA